MPNLLKSSLKSTEDSCKDKGSLVQASCKICGAPHSSVERARDCESRHVRNELHESIRRGYYGKEGK